MGPGSALARRLGRGIAHTVAWAVVLLTLFLLAVAVVVPRFSGATPYAVLTGSMRPAMPPGTLVITRPVAAEEIGIGDVVTYQLHSGVPTVVTHRVVATSYDGRGRLRFQTQGDANDVPDATWVRPVQVRGERWYSVPYVGRLNAVLTHRQHELYTYGLAALLVLYALGAFGRALRERRRRHISEVSRVPAPV